MVRAPLPRVSGVTIFSTWVGSRVMIRSWERTTMRSLLRETSCPVITWPSLRYTRTSEGAGGLWARAAKLWKSRSAAVSAATQDLMAFLLEMVVPAEI